jgi:hypothetical protein
MPSLFTPSPITQLQVLVVLSALFSEAEAVTAPISTYIFGTQNLFLLELLTWLVVIIWVGAQWIDAIIIDQTGYMMSETMQSIVASMKDQGSMGNIFYNMAQWWIVVFVVQLVAQTLIIISFAFFLTSPVATADGSVARTFVPWIAGITLGIIGLMKVRHVFFVKTTYFFIPAGIAVLEMLGWIADVAVIACDLQAQPSGFMNRWCWWFLLGVAALMIIVSGLLAAWHVAFAYYGRGVTPMNTATPLTGDGNRSVNIVSPSAQPTYSYAATQAK